MAVSFRTVGTWAELIADGSVAIPATPQAGDRMYLFARWKDFSITAQVTSPAGWTELVEFADGSTGSGNGTGSVKVACWYRDWQSGDTDPTIDFSASPTNASVVIIVMAKGATDTWLTPIAVTAAMTNWTTSSQIVAASSTAAVLGGGVVMALIGIRDDSAVMTRTASGIDDSTGAITWNGDYVEAPATHHSTTTGDDGAADLGYRLVAAGATATLRMTGTLSAAETGAGLWVVQGVEANLVINNSVHAQSSDGPALTQDHSVVVANSSHGHTSENLTLPQLHELAAADSIHGHQAENVALSQVHGLVIEDGSHSHSADDVVLATIHNLSVQDVSHAHTSDEVIVTQEHELLIANASHAHTAQSPNVRTFQIVYLDPGGDATQAVGHFNTDLLSMGLITFDTAQKVAGVGSYKFDSDTGVEVPAAVPGVMGTSRRMSFYFRYDSVPDASQTASEFASTFSEAYSGGGFSDPDQLSSDNGIYATATPAKNAGQGSKFSPTVELNIFTGAVIDSVKIIYQRKYDTDTSIGISRVKWVIDGEEGPDHDNTDMPLVDTVVEVDVTGDRGWTWQDLRNDVFQIIAEARRGDTDTAHTQSWDYVKVQVQSHLPAVISNVLDSSNNVGFQIAISPKGAGVVLRFVAGDGDSFDGISTLSPNTDYRISFSYVLHATNDLDIKIYLGGLQELSLDQASTGGFNSFANLRYGWILSPGADHLCWFDQLYIDDGDDRSDPGDIRVTAKLPAAVNEDNWDTTGGTGAVNERPLSETNYMMQTAFVSVNQSYTLQSAATGDKNLTGESLVGYMGWAWAKREAGSVERIGLIVNGADVSRSSIITTSPSLLKLPITSVSYPSNAAGIGMSSNSEDAGVFMYEAGVVVAYVFQPVNPNSILSYQQLAEGSITNLTDDLRSDPQSSYELCYRIDESEADVLITVYSIYAEGQEPQLQCVAGGQGGYGRTRITPGIEVQITVEVTGGSTGVAVWRRVNVV